MPAGTGSPSDRSPLCLGRVSEFRLSGENDFRRAKSALRRISFLPPLFIYIFVSARNDIQTERPERIQSS